MFAWYSGFDPLCWTTLFSNGLWQALLSLFYIFFLTSAIPED
jgi:hypothetical protein